VKECCANGETGGDRTGRSEMGEGGTKGKDSRIESAVAETTEEPEMRRLSVWAWASARRCCSWRGAPPSAEGLTSRPIVVLWDDATVAGVLRPTLTRVALVISITEPAWVYVLEGLLASSPSLDTGVFVSNVDQSLSVDSGLGEERPKVVLDVGEKEVVVDRRSSLNGSRVVSPSSLITSAGPNEVAARGDLADGLL